MPPTAKITSKAQITLPRRVRQRLGLQPGDEIEFIEDERGFRLRKRQAESPFSRYRGHLSHLAGQDPDSLIDEMRGQ